MDRNKGNFSCNPRESGAVTNKNKKNKKTQKNTCILGKSVIYLASRLRQGQLVKGSRRRPLTAETRVRFPYWLLI